MPGHYTRDMAITDTAVHDIDVSRWLLDDEIVAVRVLDPAAQRPAAAACGPDASIVLESAGGVLVDVEVSVNVGYGYDIRGEVVGETGHRRAGRRRRRGRPHGRQPLRPGAGRLARAVRRAPTTPSSRTGWTPSPPGPGPGPSTWDGYAATAVADAAIAALRTGERVPVTLLDRPPLYDT